MPEAGNVANSSPARAEARLREITARSAAVGKLCGRFKEIHGSRVWGLLRMNVKGFSGLEPQAFEVYGVVCKGALLPQQIRPSSPAPFARGNLVANSSARKTPAVLWN